MIFSNGFQFAINNASLPGIIVCVALLLLSCFSWAVMISKFIQLRRARRADLKFTRLFDEAADPGEIYDMAERFPHSPLFHVYRQAGDELFFQMFRAEQHSMPKVQLSQGYAIAPTQMRPISNAMERAVGEGVIQLEDKTAILATAVSGAPFLGLLGTVWGVMDTFSGVARAGGAASLQDMAPGVSAALVTTVVGLLVAIPAMFGYNYIVNKVKTTVLQLENFSSELLSVFDKYYVHYGDDEEAEPPPGENSPVGGVDPRHQGETPFIGK